MALVLAAWLLPARVAHADGLPQVAVTAATTAVESATAPVVDVAAPTVETTEATATAAVSQAAPLEPAPLVETGSRTVTETVAHAAAPVSEVAVPAVRHLSHRLARPVARRAVARTHRVRAVASQIALTHRVRAVASQVAPDVVSGVVPKTVATAAAPVPAAPVAPAESSPGAAVKARPARAVAAVSAGLPQDADSVRHSALATPRPAATRHAAVSQRRAPLSALLLFAPAPHGPAAHDSAGSAAGTPVAAPTRLRLPFFAFDLRAPAAAVRPEGVALLLHIERPD